MGSITLPVTRREYVLKGVFFPNIMAIGLYIPIVRIPSLKGGMTKNRRFYLPKWMVKIMENPMNKWMIWSFFVPIVFGFMS